MSTTSLRTLASSWRRLRPRHRVLIAAGAVVVVVLVVVTSVARGDRPSAAAPPVTPTTPPATAAAPPVEAPTEAESAEAAVEALPGDPAGGMSAELAAAGVDAGDVFPAGTRVDADPGTWHPDGYGGGTLLATLQRPGSGPEQYVVLVAPEDGRLVVGGTLALTDEAAATTPSAEALATMTPDASAVLVSAQVGVPAGTETAGPPDAGCPGVALAPFLPDDVAPDGAPVRATPMARWHPVVLIHGFTGRATHEAARSGAFSHVIDMYAGSGDIDLGDRSLVGQLQDVPGAAVYTFDYHTASARWVTDPAIGDALAEALTCLSDAYGTPVVAIAHSMGGLALRQAMHLTDDAGVPVAERVSDVVTFGTPNTGSEVSAAVGRGLDAATTSGPGMLVRLLALACGAKATADADDDGVVCGLFGNPGRMFESEAGRALRSGSSQLAELPAWPSEVRVTALAGNTVLQRSEVTWWGLAPSRPLASVAAGDVIVGVDSATVNTFESYQATCTFELNADRTQQDYVLRWVGLRADSDVARIPTPWGLWTDNPCYHGNLMRTVNLTNVATGVVADAIAAEEGIDPSDLPTAPPSAGPTGAWPVGDDELDSRGYIALGASFLGFPDWTSCEPADTRGLCLLGIGDEVVAWNNIDLEEIGRVPADTPDPRAALVALGISADHVDAALRPGRP